MWKMARDGPAPSACLKTAGPRSWLVLGPGSHVLCPRAAPAREDHRQENRSSAVAAPVTAPQHRLSSHAPNMFPPCCSLSRNSQNSPEAHVCSQQGALQGQPGRGRGGQQAACHLQEPPSFKEWPGQEVMCSPCPLLSPSHWTLGSVPWHHFGNGDSSCSVHLLSGFAILKPTIGLGSWFSQNSGPAHQRPWVPSPEPQKQAKSPAEVKPASTDQCALQGSAGFVLRILEHLRPAQNKRPSPTQPCSSQPPPASGHH